MVISTHTLTWSVTISGLKRGDNNADFNSHAHVERDNADETKFQEIVNFNSHAHVERDRPNHPEPGHIPHFNSHAHVERDWHICQRLNPGRYISTHTLTWSVTNQLFIIYIGSKYFNSHAHVERDTKICNACIGISNFNSHAHVERDSLSL